MLPHFRPNVSVGAYKFIALALLLPIASVSAAQPPKKSPDTPHQMIPTAAGMLAVDTPAGWEQNEGPGLAFFLPKGVKAGNAVVWMYISAALIGAGQEDKDVDSYIKSDIAGFKEHFKNGIARREDPLTTQNKETASVYSFQSGEDHNAFERVAYIPDVGRVWTITLSAKNDSDFRQSLPAFKQLVESYGGSIQFGSSQ